MPVMFVSSRLRIALSFSLLFAAFVLIFRPFFPLAQGTVGHDYSLAFPSLLDGYFWFRNNGLDPPWFTPAFCAGEPFFADPQSAYYSLPQLLSFVVSPLTAVYWVLLISAAMMFWGGYFLMRRVFNSSPAVGMLVGGLLMFNGFLPHRMLAGHLGYHGFALVPWIALLLLIPVRRPAANLAVATGAGVLLAYWVHSGFGTLILAGGLSILLVALVRALNGGSLVGFLVRGMLAGFVGIGLSAAKLWASFSFLANFQRTDYLLPGAASIHDAFIMIFGALFLPSQWAYELGSARLVNVQWGLAPHEWAFNFGVVVLPLALALVVDLARHGTWRTSVSPRRLLLWLLLFLGLIWPVAFNVYHPAWNAFLKTVPILSSASSAVRWVIVYIPFIAVGVGLLLERARWGKAGVFVTALCLLATVLQTAFEPREFYLSQGYDARPILIADSQLRSGKFTPKVETLGTSAVIRNGSSRIQLHGNDTFLGGVSQVYCYNPIFGYQLEKYSAEGLRQGSVFEEHDGFLNLKNPACYVFPRENNCRPGDRFRADQLAQAKDFAEYRPYAFQISPGQRAANLVTQLSLALVALAALGWISRNFLRRGSV
ncbi:MAG: hypothetical protein NT159_16985 [Proteobacteria bacterium]|nr:hypothetical protein [Pseudomonadota bacterium]